MAILAGYASNDLWGERAVATVPVLHTASSEEPASAATFAADVITEPTDPLADYKEAVDLLKQEYYGPPIDGRRTRLLTYEAIRGMLGGLRDQFSTFLDPSEWSQMQATTHGDFEGIGAVLEQKDPLGVRVVRTIEGGPAQKGGVKAGDLIVLVDGRTVHAKSINDVISLIKGPRGSRVHLGLVRGKKSLEVTIQRARVEPPVVQHWMEDTRYRIGHIALSEFNEKSIDQLNLAFADLNRQHARALVFDLRDNPGGLLDVAVAVASIFLPPNDAAAQRFHRNVVVIREGSGQEKGLQIRTLEHTHGQLPMVVLVNGGSASASEIVTGAIKDYGAGEIIGERTFGKGRVQTLFPMDDHSALRLTTALYFPPKHYDINFKRDEDGNRIDGTGGIEPDIPVKPLAAWRSDLHDSANDAQLQAGLRFLRARLDLKPIAEAAAVARLPLTR